MKKLERHQLKQLTGGFYSSESFGCMDASPCTLVVQRSDGTYDNYSGTCQLINGPCKCGTSYGDYVTSSGLYACGQTAEP